MQKNRLGNFPTRFIIEPVKFKRFFDKNRKLLDNFLKIDKIIYKIIAEGLKQGLTL